MKTKIGKRTIKNGLKLLEKDESSLLSDLGASFTLNYCPKDELYCLDYLSVKTFGAELMYALWNEMYLKVCDTTTKKPNQKILDLLDVKNDSSRLIEALVLDIVNTYKIQVGTAIVAAAILIKKGLFWMCARDQQPKPSRTIKEIIFNEKLDTQLRLKERSIRNGKEKILYKD